MIILNIEPANFSKSAINYLAKNGFSYFESKVSSNIEVEVIIVRLENYIGQEFISQYPNLKYIISPTTGTDHIDLELIDKKNIKIISLKNETRYLNKITATAELNWGLLISLARNINQAVKSVFEGNWDRNLYIGHQLSKKKLGIVGLGRLGKIIANYGTAFNMKILYYDPYVNLKKYKKCNTLVELVQESDYISINVPLNHETENLFDEFIFNKVKKGAKIINTSRGKILNEEELIIRLKNGLIGGYATDVLSNEVFFSKTKKISNNKLYNLSKVNENIIITPHIGGATSDSMIMAENYVIKKFINIFRNGE